MDESGEKDMKLLSLEDFGYAGRAVPGFGMLGRIIVWGYDTSLPKDDVETALRNHFSNCGSIHAVFVSKTCETLATDAEEHDDISYIFFFGEGAVDNALLLNGTDVGGWTVYVKPYPFKPSLKPMVWVTVEGFDTSVLSKIEIKRELIQLFSSCGEVHKYDVHVFKSGSADLIVKGEDAEEKVPKLNGSLMGQHKLVLRNVCYGHIQTSNSMFPMDGSVEKAMKLLLFPKERDLPRGQAVPGSGELLRTIVSRYDTKLPQDVVDRGRISDVCVPISPSKKKEEVVASSSKPSGRITNVFVPISPSKKKEVVASSSKPSGRITDVFVPISPSKKKEEVVASSSKPLPMDESGEKEMKLQMLLLSLKDLLSEYADCGEVGRTIVNGYDTKLLQDVVETALTNFASPSQKNEEAVVASCKTSKPLPMDESGEKMKLLLLKESDIPPGQAVPGCGVVGRIIVWGYDKGLPKDDVETALINHFSNCGMITDVCVPINDGTPAKELHEISYIHFFTGEGAVDNALLLNGTDVGGWTVYIKPYPFRQVIEKPMVWLTVEGFDTSLSKIDIKRELIELFSSCGEVDECDVHLFKSGSAELIVKGEDAAEKVPKLNGSSLIMGQHQLVLRNVCYGDIQIDFHCDYADRSGFAVPGCGEVGRIMVRGYDTRLPQDVVERALINHFSSCGRITDVCVPINLYDAEKLYDISYIYFVGEGAVDKALDLNGTDVGGWTVNIKRDPFGPDAERIIWLNVKGYDTSLTEIDIKRELIKHFSSCGEVNVFCVFKDGSADLFVKGEDAAEKVPKLDGSFMGQHKLVLRNVCYWKIRTVHKRLNCVFC